MSPSLSPAIAGNSSLPHGFDLHKLAMSLQVALAALEPLIHQASAPFHTPPNAHPSPSAQPAPAKGKASPAPAASANNGASRQCGCNIPLATFASEAQYLQRTGIETTYDLMGNLLERLDMTTLLIEQIDVTQDMPDAFMWRLGQLLREPLELLKDLHAVMRETEQD